jgi:uncharacterized protein with beta-barrel porin domain
VFSRKPGSFERAYTWCEVTERRGFGDRQFLSRIANSLGIGFCLSGSGPSATFLGPSEGHDSAVVDAGISVSWTKSISTYVRYNGLLGRDRYDSNGVSGGIRFSF